MSKLTRYALYLLCPTQAAAFHHFYHKKRKTTNNDASKEDVSGIFRNPPGEDGATPPTSQSFSKLSPRNLYRLPQALYLSCATEWAKIKCCQKLTFVDAEFVEDNNKENRENYVDKKPPPNSGCLEEKRFEIANRIRRSQKGHTSRRTDEAAAALIEQMDSWGFFSTCVEFSCCWITLGGLQGMDLCSIKNWKERICFRRICSRLTVPRGACCCPGVCVERLMKWGLVVKDGEGEFKPGAVIDCWDEVKWPTAPFWQLGQLLTCRGSRIKDEETIKKSLKEDYPDFQPPLPSKIVSLQDCRTFQERQDLQQHPPPLCGSLYPDWALFLCCNVFAIGNSCILKMINPCNLAQKGGLPDPTSEDFLFSQRIPSFKPVCLGGLNGPGNIWKAPYLWQMCIWPAGFEEIIFRGCLLPDGGFKRYYGSRNAVEGTFSRMVSDAAKVGKDQVCNLWDVFLWGCCCGRTGKVEEQQGDREVASIEDEGELTHPAPPPPLFSPSCWLANLLFLDYHYDLCHANAKRFLRNFYFGAAVLGMAAVMVWVMGRQGGRLWLGIMMHAVADWMANKWLVSGNALGGILPLEQRARPVG